MKFNKKTMIIGVIITLLCLAISIVCVVLRASVFAWIMFGLILALSIFQAICLWMFAKEAREEKESNEIKNKQNKSNES